MPVQLICEVYCKTFFCDNSVKYKLSRSVVYQTSKTCPLNYIYNSQAKFLFQLYFINVHLLKEPDAVCTYAVQIQLIIKSIFCLSWALLSRATLALHRPIIPFRNQDDPRINNMPSICWAKSPISPM